MFEELKNMFLVWIIILYFKIFFEELKILSLVWIIMLQDQGPIKTVTRRWQKIVPYQVCLVF